MTAFKTFIYASFGIGMLVGVCPWVVRWFGLNTYEPGPLRWLAIPAFAFGALMYVTCALDFVRDGDGTPAFFDPPKRLILNPWFRIVRNPMYAGVVMMIAAQAIWFGDVMEFAYAGGVLLVFHLIVVVYEEPHLRDLYGTRYISYCHSVPRWMTRPMFQRRMERSQS